MMFRSSASISSMCLGDLTVVGTAGGTVVAQAKFGLKKRWDCAYAFMVRRRVAPGTRRCAADDREKGRHFDRRQELNAPCQRAAGRFHRSLCKSLSRLC